MDRANTTKVAATSEVESPDEEPVEITHSGARKTESLEVWHKIMGHCNKSDVLRQEKVVNGMKISSKENFQCEPCILGKQVQFIRRTPDEKAESPMQFVHTDLCGPVTLVAREGFRYALSFIDDYSGAIFIYFLKKKAEASSGMLKFLADSAPFGKVTRLRSDGGGEFISKDFSENSHRK